MPDGAIIVTPADLAWWGGFCLAALLYVVLAVAVGARLVVGKLAAERLADEKGLTEPLDPGSRSWSALLLARSLSISAAVLFAATGPARAHGLAVGAVAGFLVAVLGRVAEAVIAPRWPESFLNATAWLVRLIDFLLGPLLSPLARVHENLLLRRRREIATDEDEEVREEQLEEYIRDAEEGGILEREESELLREIVDASEITAKEVMTPRVEIVAVAANDSLEAAMRVFSSSRHSRLLVHDGDLDRIVGVLPVRDLLPHLRPLEGPEVRALMRPVPHVPGTKRVLELLRELQQERHQIAVVVDEYGGTAGIVSLEDLVEEIVGEIRDEHEPDEEQIRPDERGGFLADGLVPVGDLEEHLAREISDDDVETVGGLVFSRLGRLPRLGDRVEVQPGLTLEVVRVRGRRVATVRVSLAQPAPTGQNGAP